MILRVTQFGEPVLKEAGARVENFDESLRQLAADMVETMYDEEGIGLAAQQVGHALQLFVMDVQVAKGKPDFHYTFDGKTPPLELIMPLAVINAEVELNPEHCELYEEGCLSFPGIRGNIERPTALKMRFQDVQGEHHTIECDGLFARVIQHEFDHTLGTLFIERMTPQVQRPLLNKLKRLKRDTRDFIKSQPKG